MPKRGSGPRTTVFTVPSEFVTTLVPSSLRTHCVDSPPGSVVVSLWSPLGRTSTAYVVVRPSEVVFRDAVPAVERRPHESLDFARRIGRLREQADAVVHVLAEIAARVGELLQEAPVPWS